MLKISCTPRLITDKGNKKGDCPISIFIQCRLGRTKKSTGISIKPDQWDGSRIKRNHPLHYQFNQALQNQLTDIQRKITEYELSGRPLSFTVIKSLVHGDSVSASIIQYGERLIIELANKFSPATIQIYQCELSRLRRYAGEGLSFLDINQAWLRKYENYLYDNGLTENTVHKVWKVLKKLFNQARRDKLITEYPFSDYDNPKYRQTDKTYLTLEEVQRIEGILKMPIPEAIRITVNYFLLGCYSSLRYSDWRRFDYGAFVKDNRLMLRAKKNGELINLPMNALLTRVVERLKDLPPIFEESATNAYLKSVAKLAGIDKHITTHTARHSFAIRCAELDIPRAATAKFMGITEKSCEWYYKIVPKKLDAEFSKWNKLAE